MIRVSIMDILESKGYEVVESADAAQALTAFDSHKIDLLLTDVGLPDMSGVDLARLIRARLPRLPVIFATGDDSVSGIDLDGQTRILQKPYGSDALHKLIVDAFAG
jgi:DNA-binding response OmpR family regulator